MNILANISDWWNQADQTSMAALQLAIVFSASVIIAKLSGLIKFLPKVTAYLLVGLALSQANLLNSQAVSSMTALREVALSLMLFLVGAEFRLESLAQGLRHSFQMSKWDVGLTFLAVAALTFATALITGMDQALIVAILLGILAIETGPVSTIAVLREHNSHGPFTDYLKLSVANVNIAALVFFAIAAVFVFPTGEHGMRGSLTKSAWWLFGALPLGVLLGLFLAWSETWEKKPALRLLIMLAVVMAAIGLSKALGASQLLAVIVAGFAYANSSTRGMPAIETVRLLETPFYVIFFVYAGASLHIDELPHIGAVGIAYVVARTVTKYMGTYIGAKRSGHPRKRCALLGASMLSHSAIVLALLEVIKERVGPTASLATSLQTLILGSVVVFEVFGPILVKISVLRSGEVSIVNAVPHKSRVVVGNQLFGVLKTFLGHLGFRITPKERTLASLVIQDTRALSAASDFDKLTRFIEHYPYDSFPVVDGKGVYLGFISFNEIKDASYDPVMKELVRAADLLTPSKPIDLDKDTIDTAYELIRNHTSTSLPVIRHDKEGKTLLVGVILQRDLTAAHVRAVTSPDQPNSADSNRLRAASDDEQA